MVRHSSQLEGKVDAFDFKTDQKNFRKEVEQIIRNHTVSQDQRYLDEIESRHKVADFKETIRNYVKMSQYTEVLDKCMGLSVQLKEFDGPIKDELKDLSEKVGRKVEEREFESKMKD